MDIIPSAEFRKRYASLRAPTLVTVNGHTIGTWTPANPERPSVVPVEVTQSNDRFNTRPFTPAPKGGKSR